MAKSIPLTQGYFAVVDDQDAPMVERHRWTVLRSGNTCYAKTRINGRTVYLHRFIMFEGNAGDSKRKVDHINGKGLDNRRRNLRPVWHAQNMMNSVGRRAARKSRYKGVSVRLDSCKPFRASIHVAGKQKHLGFFKSEALAAYAYDIAAREYFGQHARPNFPTWRITDRRTISTMRFQVRTTVLLPPWRYRLK